MARFSLLGAGPWEEIPCVVIESDVAKRRIERKAGELIATAKRLHAEWLADPASIDKKLTYGRALDAAARFCNNRKAQDWAYRLLNGFPL